MREQRVHQRLDVGADQLTAARPPRAAQVVLLRLRQTTDVELRVEGGPRDRIGRQAYAPLDGPIDLDDRGSNTKAAGAEAHVRMTASASGISR